MNLFVKFLPIRPHRYRNADAAAYFAEFVTLRAMAFQATLLHQHRGHQAQIRFSIDVGEFENFFCSTLKLMHGFRFPGIGGIDGIH